MLAGQRLLLCLTLLGHLPGSLGIPWPAVRRSGSLADLPYPCQTMACGCLSYQQCWAGDCCCYSLRDGSVRFVRDRVNAATWAALGSRADGDLVGDF